LIDIKLLLQLTRFYNRIYPRLSKIRGSYRIKSFLDYCGRRSADSIIQFCILGTRVAGPKNSGAIDFFLGDKHKDEVSQLKYVIENIEKNEVFVDVGSAYGLFSSVVANRTNAEVHAFDPLKINYLFLELNSELNDYDFNCYQKAVSNSAGETSLNTFNSTEHTQINGDKGSNTIEQVKLDDFLDDIDYIKIDVEGAEMRVLEGAKKLIEKKRPVILLEVHNDASLESFGDNRAKILEFLRQNEYKIPKKLKSEIKHNENVILEPRK
jgi:FkbM family methyltransferase